MSGLSRRGIPGAFVFAGLLLLALLISSGLCFAASPGGHDNGKLLWDLFYRFVNFALLVIILVIVVKKSALSGYFSARRKEIQTRLDALREGKKRSESRYLELERKVKEFENSRLGIIEQFKAEGMLEKEKIIAQAKERVQQILAQADLTIEREVQAARNRLKHQIVDAATAKAQEIIARQIGESDQDQLVNDFIAKVERLH
jgi:F-type H+-transporting ATPase subunit b